MYLLFKRIGLSTYSGIRISAQQIFLISSILVSGGNYFYNLMLARLLSPSAFAEISIVVTFLLVTSFIAMTFQMASTKFCVELEGDQLLKFKRWFSYLAINTGVILSVLMIVFSDYLTTFLYLSSSQLVIIFALSLPVYFLMSVHRGFVQADEKFIKLSISYQTEMWTRLTVTFILIMIYPKLASVWVSSSILISILIGYLSIRGNVYKQRLEVLPIPTKPVWSFFAMTASYEVAQVIINYSDLIIVKHFFDNQNTGLYTSITMIGKMIYFATWMVVMILIPRVLRLKKEGKPYRPKLIRYFSYILILNTIITGIAYLFPTEIVGTLFGEQYLDMSHLLWKYSLATSFFALSNICVYYFLSINKYLPVLVAICFGLLQMYSLIVFHENIEQVIDVQVFVMLGLLIFQMLYFLIRGLHVQHSKDVN